MELYTSLTRLKQAMNGGRMPPMTPVPAAVHHIIDPAFTIGLGALSEDPDSGLRCPVRGCGIYRHALQLHIDTAHRAIGGAAAVKRALGIPQSAPLISAKRREDVRQTVRPNFGRLLEARRSTGLDAPAAVRANAVKASQIRAERTRSGEIPDSRLTVGRANAKNRCPAQITHAIQDLANELGRTPTFAEFLKKYPDARAALKRAFGTWNSALAQCELALNLKHPRYGRGEIAKTAVLAALSAWHSIHGDLPTEAESKRGDRTPYLPHPATMMHAMGCNSHTEAMRRAAALLDIHGGRYGLPIRRTV